VLHRSDRWGTLVWPVSPVKSSAWPVWPVITTGLTGGALSAQVIGEKEFNLVVMPIHPPLGDIKVLSRTHLSGTAVSLVGGDPGVPMSHMDRDTDSKTRFWLLFSVKKLLKSYICIFLWKWFSKQIYWYDFHISKLNYLKVIHHLYIPNVWPKPYPKRLLLPNRKEYPCMCMHVFRSSFVKAMWYYLSMMATICSLLLKT
jgi:hypothetical protein